MMVFRNVHFIGNVYSYLIKKALGMSNFRFFLKSNCCKGCKTTFCMMIRKRARGLVDIKSISFYLLF